MTSRRKFFRYLVWLTFIPFLFIVNKMLKRYDELNKRKNMRVLKTSLSNGTNVFPDVIIIRDGNKFEAFSSRCTHLGCKINTVEGRQLVCPCHGSRYDLEGSPLKGPANKPLQKLEIDVLETELMVKIDS